MRSLQITLALAALILGMGAVPASAFDPTLFSLGFGTAETQVMYYNSKVDGFGDLYPGGPNGFCVFDKNRVAIADTFNGAVKVFDEQGKLIEKIDVLELVKDAIDTDEILITSVSVDKNDKNETEFIVADTLNGKIYLISGGKLTRSFGSNGSKPFEFTQLEEVGVVPGLNIIASDHGSNKVVVFSKDGTPIKEFAWTLGGFQAIGRHIYTLDRLENGTAVAYRKDISRGRPEFLLGVQNPAWRNGRLLGVDRFGNLVAAFFDDSIQEQAMKAAGRPCKNGFFTLALISPTGQVRESRTVPVTVPMGYEFCFDRSDGTLYYQDYDADAAPEGRYRIAAVKFATEFSETAEKLGPTDLVAAPTTLTKIDYGTGRDQLSGNLESVRATPPLLRADGTGDLYLLDRNGNRLLCGGKDFSAVKTIDLAEKLGLEDRDGLALTDLYVLSSAEIVLLDSTHETIYRLVDALAPAAAGTGPVAIRKTSYAGAGDSPFDRIYANAIGETMLYSSLGGRLALYGADGKPFDAKASLAVASFLVMPTSDVISLSQNAERGLLTLAYADFYGNPLKRFEADSSIKVGNPVGVTAGIAIGTDANQNIYATYFDGSDQRIGVFSINGNKIRDLKIANPQNYRYFETSACVGVEGSVYVGLPTAANYSLVKLP